MKYLLVILLLSTSQLIVAQSYSSKGLPLLDQANDYYDSLAKQGKHAELAQWISVNNRELRASKLALYAALEYARAGQADSAVVAVEMALNYGMTNPNILGKHRELNIVRQSDHWPSLEQRLAQLAQRLRQPTNFAVDTESLATFWPYFHQALKDTTQADSLLSAYVIAGPDATRDFYVQRYLSADNMSRQMVRQTPNHYLYTEKVLNPEKLDTIQVQVGQMMRCFAERYSAAVFPKVYIMPGILNSGGTASDLGLYIGGEMFVKTDSMPTDGLNEWQQNAVGKLDRMKYTIMHELMHFQQSYQDTARANTLLAGVIKEGVCDFLVTLCADDTTRSEAVAYLDHPDSIRAVLHDFQKNMYSEDLSDWMYGNSGKYPTDLGYALGYKICKSYYERSDDPTEALYQLLNTDDFTRILAGSEYGDLVATLPESK